MQSFFDLDRIDAVRRDVTARIKDYEEIYEIFPVNKSKEQAERCIQCGDPFCHDKCPLHNLIPQWLKSNVSENLELSFALSNDTSPFPEVLGRICPHDRLCEGDCTLNDGHGAITIGSIETFITEEGFKQGLRLDFPKIKYDKKVAVIGAGPAGLSTATFLARLGVKVEIFDKQNRAGGLLTYGIPGFKLDKKIIERRVNILKKAGVIFHQNIEVENNKFNKIYSEFDAIFIGTGATSGNISTIEGSDSKNSYLAMDFLVSVQKKLFNEEAKFDIDIQEKTVVVIGGGDTAMDCVRTSLREKARNIKCLYRRDADSMPGSKKEYLNAKEEGIDFKFFVSPTKILTDSNNNIIGIRMMKTELIDGKLQNILNSDFIVDCDIVIFALGFKPIEYDFLKLNNIQLDIWKNISINKNYETTKENVFAGGDCIRGADLVVTAAFDGRESAKAIFNKIIKSSL